MSILICSGILSLKKAAKKSGGDSYVGTLKCSEAKVLSEITIYVPQSISRKGSAAPREKVMMKVCVDNSVKKREVDAEENGGEVELDENVVVVKLAKVASSGCSFPILFPCVLTKPLTSILRSCAGGGDRYEGDVDGTTFTPYIPQCFSRYNNPSRHKTLIVAFKEYNRKKILEERTLQVEARKKARLETREASTHFEVAESKEDDNSYERTYSEEARRDNAVPMSFERLRSVIEDGRLELLGRSQEQHATYVNFMSAIKQEWSGVSDYILATKIGLPFFNGDDGKKSVDRAGSSFNSFSVEGRNGKTFFLKNDFPYNFENGVSHYVLWKLGSQIVTAKDSTFSSSSSGKAIRRVILDDDDAPASSSSSSCDITAAITRFVNEEAITGTDFLYYINPPSLKSIPEIDHAHVIMRSRQDGCFTLNGISLIHLTRS